MYVYAQENYIRNDEILIYYNDDKLEPLSRICFHL